MGDEDDTPGTGSPLPRDLFAAAREAREREVRAKRMAPIGLGDTSAAEAGPELHDLSILRQILSPEELMCRSMDQLGPEKSAEVMVAKYGRQKALALIKGTPGRLPLTPEQIQHRVLLANALRRSGCLNDAAAARVIAKAYGEKSHESVRRAISTARCRSAELGLPEPQMSEEDLRWLAERVRAAARPGGKKLRGFISARKR